MAQLGQKTDPNSEVNGMSSLIIDWSEEDNPHGIACDIEELLPEEAANVLTDLPPILAAAVLSHLDHQNQRAITAELDDHILLSIIAEMPNHHKSKLNQVLSCRIEKIEDKIARFC